MIDWFIQEMQAMELANVWLINKAKQLPLCRRNILFYKILMWHKYITCLCMSLLNPEVRIHEELRDINSRVKKFLEKSKLATKHFLDFFFNIHRPIASRFEAKIEEIINSNMNVREKVVGLCYYYKELMNLTRIELEGLELDCDILGNNKICGNHQCKNQPNIVTLMITPEYVEDPRIIEEVVNALTIAVKPKTITLIVDYRNLCDYWHKYSWEETGAYERYKKCINFVKDIYFYRADCVDFGKYYNELKDKIIKSKSELKGIIKKCLEEQGKHYEGTILDKTSRK